MAQVAQTAFFSYCRVDSEFALRLAEDLKAAGANVWMDQLDIEPGIAWDRAVEIAVTNCPRILVILSPTSVNSDNVRDEISFALSKQKRVIPVLYRECDVPFRLARLQHIDFRTDYARGLKTLLKTLGVEQQSFAAGGSEVSAVPRESRTEEEERVAREKAKEAQMRADAERGRKEAEPRTRAEAERIAQQEAERAREKAEAERQQKRLEKPGKEPLTGECTEAEHRAVNEAEQAHANVEVSRVGIDEAEAGLAVQRALAEGTARNKSKKQAVETKEPQIPKRKWLDRLQVNARRKFLIYIVASTSLIAVAILALALWHRARTATPEPDQKLAIRSVLAPAKYKYVLQYALGGYNFDAVSVAFSPDNQLLAACGWSVKEPDKINIWEVSKGELRVALKYSSARDDYNSCNHVGFSPDGLFLLAGGGASNRKVKVWNTSSWKLVDEFIPTSSFFGFAFSSPDELAVATFADLTLRDFPRRRSFKVLENGEFTSVASSPDRRWLAAARSDPDSKEYPHRQIVRLWTTANWEQRFNFPTDTSATLPVTFSPDSSQIAAPGSTGKTTIIWDLATGQPAHTLEVPRVYSLAFSPDGRVLACAVSSAVILWDTTDWTELQRLLHDEIDEVHSGNPDLNVYSVAFSSDGQLLATASADRTKVRLWRRTE